MANWDNQKALIGAIQDWQRQLDAFRQLTVQQSPLEQYTQDILRHPSVLQELRPQTSLLEQFRRDYHLQTAFFDELRRNVSALESVKKSIAALSVPYPATQLGQLLGDMTRARNALGHSTLASSNPWISLPWATTQSQMESALRFLPRDIDGPEPEWRGLFDRIEADVAAAPLLGHALVQDISEEDPPPSTVETVAGAQLIEVVPAGALADLEAVGFSPLRLLDQAVRDPEFLMQIGSREFEELTAALVEKLGIEDVILTPAKGDGGRDVIGTINIAGLGIVVAFECKRYSKDSPVGVETARALLGTITHSSFRADRGVLVTTSRFTKGATEFILTTPQLHGVDFEELREWLARLAGSR